jgi:hypothetical protein
LEEAFGTEGRCSVHNTAAHHETTFLNYKLGTIAVLSNGGERNEHYSLLQHYISLNNS